MNRNLSIVRAILCPCTKLEDATEAESELVTIARIPVQVFYVSLLVIFTLGVGYLLLIGFGFAGTHIAYGREYNITTGCKYTILPNGTRVNRACAGSELTCSEESNARIWGFCLIPGMVTTAIIAIILIVIVILIAYFVVFSLKVGRVRHEQKKQKGEYEDMEVVAEGADV